MPAIYLPDWNVRFDDARQAQRARRDFLMHLQEWGSRTSDFAAAALAFDELVANVVGHAPGSIRIDLEWSTCRPILHVSDAGPGFALDSTSFTEAGAGRGLVRVKALVGPLSVRRRTSKPGTRVSVTLPVHRRECDGSCGRAGCA